MSTKLDTINYKLPLISIITVVYNYPVGLEETIQNIIGQTYQNIEYIIVDGASSDNTLTIIKKYEKYLSCWISEPDKGIYDAMNKGLQLASGSWVNFMNAGDKFYATTTLSDLFLNISYPRNLGFLYGNHQADYQNGYKREVEIGKEIHPLVGMPFCHQSTFVRLSLHQEILFDTNYKFAADYQFFLKLISRNIPFQYIPKLISSIETSGTAEINIIKTFKEQKKIATYFSTTLLKKIKTKWYFNYKIFRAKVVSRIKKNSSTDLNQKLTQLKYFLIGH